MSVFSGPEIFNDGLVFAYDMNNSQKSWNGKPTTNFAYTRNARTDSSYAPYSATSLGTWNAKHPDAIRVYNDLGSEISAYSNTGVTDWTNTYHAIWTLDPILNRSVVTMRDIDGSWKAKSFGLGQTMTSMGLGYGSTYTISWLQWTDDIAKSTNAGLYGQNTSGSNGFHDGLSNSKGTSYNTLPFTWQRVYATFTVSGVWNLSAGLNCYMYGHYIKRGTLRVVDVQIETGVPSGFSKQQTRSNTQAVLDFTNNNTVTATSLTHKNDGTFSFDGISNGVDTFTLNSYLINGFTLSAWIKPLSSGGGTFGRIFDKTNNNTGSSSGLFFYMNANPIVALAINGGTTINSTANSVPFSQWTYVSVSVTDSGACSIYINGSLNATGTTGLPSAITNTYPLRIGNRTNATDRGFNGDISYAKIYNRALSASEVQDNFNALRGRYGI